MAHLSGFSQIITTAQKKHESLLKAHGATHIIDRSQDAKKQIEEIRSLAPDLQYAWDAIASKDTVEVAARSFGPNGGKIVGSLSIDVSQYPGVTGGGIYSNPNTHAKTATVAWSNLEQAFKKGQIKPLPFKVWGGLAKTAEALKAVKTASGEKIIVHPQE